MLLGRFDRSLIRLILFMFPGRPQCTMHLKMCRAEQFLLTG
jgi:hypothetical protein